jgi:hypothetical protein
MCGKENVPVSINETNKGSERKVADVIMGRK